MNVTIGCTATGFPPLRGSTPAHEPGVSSKISSKFMWNNFDYIAVYGAILSTVAVGWNLIAWRISRPRLDIVAASDVYEWRGKIEELPEERQPADKNIRYMKPFITVEVRNVGGSATTILDIRFAQNDSPDGMKKMMNSTRSYEPLAESLPTVLEAGHVWLCRFDQEEALELHKENNLLHFSVDVRHTHSKNWIRQPVEIWNKS